jgi:tyrosyl-tRNA synthetase
VLAKEITIMVHSKEEYEMAIRASDILFGDNVTDTFESIREDVFLSIFEGVPQFEIPSKEIERDVLSLLTEDVNIFPSKGELRRLIQGGGISLNRKKISDPAFIVTSADFITGKYLIVQKGKKNYFLVKKIEN